MALAVRINPGLLTWARETAGLSLEEAAVKLGLKPTRQSTAEEKLAQAERGERPATRALLEKAAATYRRPLVAFYLPQPPARAERTEDFRTVTRAARPQEDAMLDALVRDVRARQQLLRAALLDDEDTKRLAFVASCRMANGARNVATEIRKILGVAVPEQRRASGAAALFALLRAAAESAGIYVLLLGDLGSHHSDMSEEIFRGVALADDVAPFIVINDNDATTARSFSLIHELAHIWIGASGISGPMRGNAHNAIERFCNEVAGEFLLPREALPPLSDTHGMEFERAIGLTDSIAKTWNISQGVVAFRFLLNGWISDAVATQLFQAFADRWRVQKARERENRESDDAGPSFYVVRRAKLGAGLLNSVRRALETESLTHTKAARILGVQPAAVNQLLREQRRIA